MQDHRSISVANLILPVSDTHNACVRACVYIQKVFFLLTQNTIKFQQNKKEKKKKNMNKSVFKLNRLNGVCV